MLVYEFGFVILTVENLDGEGRDIFQDFKPHNCPKFLNLLYVLSKAIEGWVKLKYNVSSGCYAAIRRTGSSPNINLRLFGKIYNVSFQIVMT